MSYRPEFMRGDEVAVPYEGDVLTTPEIAHAVGVATFAQMQKDVGATSFRLLDRHGDVVATGPDDAH